MKQTINIHIRGAGGGSDRYGQIRTDIVSAGEGPSTEGLSIVGGHLSQAPSPEMVETLSADFTEDPSPEDMNGNNAFFADEQYIGSAPSPDLDMQESIDMASAPEPQDDPLTDLVEKPAELKKVKTSRAKK